jgi:hypothetical protein
MILFVWFPYSRATHQNLESRGFNLQNPADSEHSEGYCGLIMDKWDVCFAISTDRRGIRVLRPFDFKSKDQIRSESASAASPWIEDLRVNWQPSRGPIVTAHLNPTVPIRRCGSYFPPVDLGRCNKDRRPGAYPLPLADDPNSAQAKSGGALAGVRRSMALAHYSTI